MGSASSETSSPSAPAATTPDETEPTGTPAPALPNPVTTPVEKVTREGQSGPPSITAAAPVAQFAQTVTYTDGLTLGIAKARAGVESGHGPGVFAGREYVIFDLEMTNGASAPIDLSSAVVTTYYGDSKQLAASVYSASADTVDFGGTLAPGAKTTARYAFAVPKSDLSNVTMVVDFDGAHASAVYAGSVGVS